MKSNEIAVCIFSYNQGNGLRKCVNSFLDMAPDLDLYIFDDASDNQETLAVIEEVKNSINKVFYSEMIIHDEKKRHGNLYENMQNFYLYCIEKKYKYMFFV
ncbi:MAG: glycosyltransferase, partial [Campylobacterales bacterium]|nr:glycosyltransferase [Campylobacterales bacterium]